MGATLSVVQSIISIAIILFIAVLAYLFYNFVFGNGEGSDCSAINGTIWPFSGCNISAGLCCNGKCSKGPCEGTEQGEACTIESDCKGWSVYGEVGCCNNKCVKRAWYGQRCDAKVEGDACSEPSGTIWPFSGCDISAGMCCNGKCSSTPCPPGLEGQPCSAPSGTWWPFSGCNVSAGLCCNGKCATSCPS